MAGRPRRSMAHASRQVRLFKQRKGLGDSACIFVVYPQVRHGYERVDVRPPASRLTCLEHLLEHRHRLIELALPPVQLREVVQADGDVRVPGGEGPRRSFSVSRKSGSASASLFWACRSPRGCSGWWRCPGARWGGPRGRSPAFAEERLGLGELVLGHQELARLFRRWRCPGARRGGPPARSPALHGRAARPRRACSGPAGASRGCSGRWRCRVPGGRAARRISSASR